MLHVSQRLQCIARANDDELGFRRANDARHADRIVLARRVRLVVAPRDLLLHRVGMNHGNTANGAVGLDDVDHAPRTEMRQG